MNRKTNLREELDEKRSLSSWMQSVGMKFNPFEILESSGDPNLSKYMINHDEFVNTWGNWPSFVFAPPGAGKTAMRIRLTQACFTGGENNRPFPVNYSLPFLKWGGHSVSFDDHLSEITWLVGLYLLLYISYRPYRFFELSAKDRKYMVNTFNWILPGSLKTFIEPSQQTKDLQYLKHYFPPATLPPLQETEPNELSRLWRALESDYSPTTTQISVYEKWESVVNVLINLLKFSSIYLMVDGVDASPDTSESPEISLNYLFPLLSKTEMWNSNNIYLKFFLPVDVEPFIKRDFNELLEHVKPIRIEWNLSGLTDLIRKRVYVASQGKFGSLQTLTSPAVSEEIEMEIARAVEPLPREMLVFVDQLLLNHVRSRRIHHQIQLEEFDATLDWYKKDRELLG